MIIRPVAAVALSFALAAGAVGQPKPTVSPEEEKARDLFRAGKFDDALKELEKAGKADAKLPPARVTLADYFYRANQGQAARVQLEQAIAENPRHPAAYLLNGSFAFGEGRLTDTALNCRTALDLAADPRWDPDQRKKFVRDARLGLASVFESRRDWAAAKENLVAVLNEDAKNTNLRTRVASATFHLGFPEQALAEFQAAWKDDPSADLPELRMAALWGAKDDLAKAEEWLKKGVAAHDRDARPARTYAGFLLDSGKADAAKPYLDAAVKLDPKARETIALKGLFARYKKDFPAAEEAFEALAKDYPNDPFAAWNLALVLIESADAGKKRRALDLAESEVRKNQRSAEGFAVLGWCLYKSGRVEEAEKALAAASSPGTVSRDLAYFTARLLTDQGKFGEAKKLLKGAATAKGPFPYRADAEALLAEVEKKAPPDKDEPKK